jgi:hypothetical protein
LATYRRQIHHFLRTNEQIHLILLVIYLFWLMMIPSFPLLFMVKSNLSKLIRYLNL